MHRLARFVVARRWWVVAGWLLLAVAGAVAAGPATSALSYDFGLPDQPGYEANQQLVQRFGSGGANAPVLLVVGDGSTPVAEADGRTVAAAARKAAPGSRVASFTDHPELRSDDGRTAVVLVYPRPVPGGDPYAAALPALRKTTQTLAEDGTPVVVTGQDELSSEGGDGGGGATVLAETLFGGVGALIVLVLVFGSFLSLMPLAVAVASILTTFLAVWVLTGITDVSFIVQFLLALIGLGVAIDYALLVVTRWREERGRGADNREAVERAVTTAGRSVLFSGLTVAVSLAALIALPVPFLRSVGFTGLLIPVVSVAAALTLLPALLVVTGPRLAWPHRRASDPTSRLWHRVGSAVTTHRWVSIVVAGGALLALAAPVLALRLGPASTESLTSAGGPSASALTRVGDSGIGAGLVRPVEIVTDRPDAVVRATSQLDGVAGAIAPADWRRDTTAVVNVWTSADEASTAGTDVAARVRDVAEQLGATVGGAPAQDADFLDAVYGNAWWVGLVIVVVTFLLLARSVRSVVLPLKALLLNVVSIAAAYGVTVLIWQEGFGVEFLFDQPASGSLTIWLPVAAFAFLFGLSMDYEVFLLTRIREERDAGHDTIEATVRGVARTGRLISCAALILFLSFVALSRVPQTDVKILATALALGIVLDATVVRGVLAPALVAAFGRANWWYPFGRRAVPDDAPATPAGDQSTGSA
ncbi:MMPL family transporter [Jatrophihabitans fulvus]